MTVTEYKDSYIHEFIDSRLSGLFLDYFQTDRPDVWHQGFYIDKNENFTRKQVYHTGTIIDLIKEREINIVLDILVVMEKPIRVSIQEIIRENKVYIVDQGIGGTTTATYGLNQQINKIRYYGQEQNNIQYDFGHTRKY